MSASHGSHFSPLVEVSPGEAVVGSNTLGSDGITWQISAAAPGKQPSTVRIHGAAPRVAPPAAAPSPLLLFSPAPFLPPQLNFKPVPGAWPTAYHVLEAYGVTTECDLYPAAGAVNFTGISLAFGGNAAPSPIAWQFLTQTAGCGERASSSAGGGEVSISFRTQ